MNASHLLLHMINSHTCASSSLAEKLIVCITRRQPPPTYCPCWTDNGGPLQLPMGRNSILNTQLFCLSLSLHSLAASLLSLFSLCYIPPFAADKLLKPHGKTDVDLRSLWTNWTRHYDHFVLRGSLNSKKTLTTRSDTAAANTTTCLGNTNPLSATKQQRLWLHLRTFLSLWLEHRLIKLIRTSCADQNRTLFGEIFHKWL